MPTAQLAVWVLLPLAVVLIVGNTTAVAVCPDDATISYIEDVLEVDVLYLTRGKGARCRAKVSGTER
jgi:hypothetical protein